MRRWVPLLLLAVAAGALALVALPDPTAPPEMPPRSPLLTALRSEVRPHGQDPLQCMGCHFGWSVPFDLNGTRAEAPAGPAWYNLTLAPTAGYSLVLAYAAPRSAGDGLAEAAEEDQQATVPPGGGDVRLRFEVPFPSAAVSAEAWSLDSYLRPPLRTALDCGTGEVAGEGSPPNQHALVRAAGAPLGGACILRITALDPADSGSSLRVRFRAVPVGFEVRTASVTLNASVGAPAAFAWQLPRPGQPGAPERLAFGVVVFDDHPTDRWKITTNGDRGFYEGSVAAAEAAEPAPPPPDAAAWPGGDTVVLHEESFDGVLVRSRNDRGEWRHNVLHPNQLQPECPLCPIAAVPPPSAPQGRMPPGTTHVVATLTWSPRTPLAAAPAWALGVTQRPDPDFRYPEPTTEGEGRRGWVVPVAPQEWEADGEAWFQAIPLLLLGEGERAVFDGTYSFRVEARRGPLPDGAAAAAAWPSGKP